MPRPQLVHSHLVPAADNASIATDTDLQGLPAVPPPELPVDGKGLGSLGLRVIFGTVLGLLGAVVITAGK